MNLNYPSLRWGFKNYTMKRKYTEDFKIQVARDFHFTGMTTLELADKYKVAAVTTSEWARLYPKEHFKSLATDNESAIIVNSDDLLAAQLAIEYFGIPILKADNIIIEQQYVSKI